LGSFSWSYFVNNLCGIFLEVLPNNQLFKLLSEMIDNYIGNLFRVNFDVFTHLTISSLGIGRMLLFVWTYNSTSMREFIPINF
jgi:hypothetical protein